ncbi:MAG: radical SAM protein [Candidatus Hodarchaeales archaeon]|jgi:tRNA wybutosine-synthesizing protein 1
MTDKQVKEFQIHPTMKRLLKKQKYQLSGKNTAVKKCGWTHNALRENRYCYKRAYGINSHQCIQFSPVLICNFLCRFCWRVHESDIGIENMYSSYDPLDEEKLIAMFDSPEEVAEEIFASQKRIIVGYKPYITKSKYEEAMNPKHATLSLTGEPFLYPWIPELISELKKKDMTVFIVSNGTVPDRLEEILNKRVYPTQLYITLPAPGLDNFLHTHRPIDRNKALPRIWDSLRIIGKGVPFRTVARLTVAEGLNLIDPEGYSKMIDVMKPSFIEIKGVVHVGAAEHRLPRSAMPSHQKIKEFSFKISELTGYDIVSESEVSKLVILSNHSHPLLIPKLKSNLLNI